MAVGAQLPIGGIGAAFEGPGERTSPFEVSAGAAAKASLLVSAARGAWSGDELAAAWGPTSVVDDALVAAAAALTATGSPEDLGPSFEEQDVETEVALHDARLEKLKLAGALERFEERPPTVEELAEFREAELQELVDEVERLREENAALAFRSNDDDLGGPRQRARTAAEELHDEVSSLRARHFAHARGQRRVAIEEWRLEVLRREAQVIVRELRTQERLVEEARDHACAAEGRLQKVRQRAVDAAADLEREHDCIRELNAEVLDLRESCYLPARLKRESEFVMKILDQGGCGRLNTRRHLRGVQACARLYDAVSEQAPALLPLASRARAALDAEFARYSQLEEAHGRALLSVQAVVTRELYEQHRSVPACGGRRSFGAHAGRGV